MSRRRRVWSASDEELLRELVAEGEPMSLIALALKRSEKAVYLRGDLLGVKVSKFGRRAL